MNLKINYETEETLALGVCHSEGLKLNFVEILQLLNLLFSSMKGQNYPRGITDPEFLNADSYITARRGLRGARGKWMTDLLGQSRMVFISISHSFEEGGGGDMLMFPILCVH